MIVEIGGGLGNQMFQYAFALALSKHYGKGSVALNASNYKETDNVIMGGGLGILR